MTTHTDVVILGAGRGSAELIDLLDGTSFQPRAVLDDRWPDGPGDVHGVVVTGTLSSASHHVSLNRLLLMGIANARSRSLRGDIHRRLDLPDSAWTVFRDPASSVSGRAQLGAGSILYPGVRVGTNAALGKQVVVYYNAVIHHDCKIGDGVAICAGAILAGHVRVGEGSYLGAGCLIRDGVTIGRNVLVGMGAVVTQDVPDDWTVVGVPARRLADPRVVRA